MNRGFDSLAGACLLVALACAQPGPDASSPSASALADTLKNLIADAYDFSRPGAQERMASLYADRERLVSATGGEIVSTRDSLVEGIHSFWDRVGRNMRDARWTWEQVFVERLGPDAAVLTATWSIPHIAPHGGPHVLRGAWTAAFKRMPAGWRIVQEHLSVPQPAADTGR